MGLPDAILFSRISRVGVFQQPRHFSPTDASLVSACESFPPVLCFTDMGADSDPDLISSITPDVMISLDRAGFFRKLDDVLCPADGSPAGESCGGDYKLSKSILQEAGFDPSDLKDIFSVLCALGGCCDCEILCNVAESSRLKAKYWRSRGRELSDQRGLLPHRDRGQ